MKRKCRGYETGYAFARVVILSADRNGLVKRQGDWSIWVWIIPVPSSWCRLQA
ncbi:uncharacterized protein HMPREF1541_09737 [Cyphellophora europaea CBS 101466]|uniref:Uncharacterized protein n=1 Tax=Cyphellophora europaea (strain CBS 101466) TaxID=1220924 RepID=W2S873_CYPE1|nr:uncharacterized protein HMPREF1541_09737 [Cyphellophora europaea CBS 101466]ETN44862.1 hypothetical protein HMPREF1541_09737 [Cyphellophora europaea CBS 101466]